MSEPNSGKVRCEKCLGSRRIPMIGNDWGTETCDECRGEGWVIPARRKPPLGPTPDFIWRESRMEELTMACKRKMDAGLFPNQPWLVEIAEHRAWFKATGRDAPCETEWETPLSAGAHYLNEAAEILERNKNERNS